MLHRSTRFFMLEVKSLCKRYRGLPAIDNVSFRVGAGEIVGYVGPNGSGKSTTVKIVTGLLEPNDGQVLFEGESIRNNLQAYRAAFGYVPEEAHVYTHLSGLEYLQLVGRLRNMSEALIDLKANRLLSLLGLESWRHSPISLYSKGMKQRVLISASLLHDPKLLIFDEPLSGLDVVSARLFKDLLEALAVQAERFTAGREQSQFEILVRHIFYRFLHNELLTSDDDETKRVMQISCAIAVPGMIVALFLFPAYHAFPPYPVPRPFWSQAGDHYFYVMYSFVVMGAATVFEWDLLFPDLVDVFVLSIQPIASRHLFFARVLALAIFLGLVLFGTSILGILFMPLVAELPNFLRHLLAHSTAVFASGTFAAATFLALQGVLLNIVGENIFRRITPLLQGTSIMFLLAILLLHPTLSRSLEPLLSSGAPAVRL